MNDVLIVLATIGWILLCALIYGALVGRSVQECAREATGFACASGLFACIGVALLRASW